MPPLLISVPNMYVCECGLREYTLLTNSSPWNQCVAAGVTVSLPGATSTAVVSTTATATETSIATVTSDTAAMSSASSVADSAM